MWTHIPTLGSIHQVTTCMHPPFPTNRVSEIKLYIWNKSHSHVHQISCVDLVVCRMYCHLYLECINGYQVGLGCNEPIFIFIVQLIWHHLSDLEIWSGRCVVQVQVRYTGHAAALQTPTWQLAQKQSIVLAQCDVTCKDVFTITLLATLIQYSYYAQTGDVYMGIG